MKKCRPFVAILFSIITTGLGHLYCGHLRKAIYFFIAPYIVAVLGLTASIPQTFLGLIIILCISIGLSLYIIADSMVVAKQQKERKLNVYNRWYIYLIIIFIDLFFSRVVLDQLKDRKYHSYQIPTGSMENTIMPGDHIVADLKYYKKNALQSGSIVIYQSSLHEQKSVHRCVATENQTVKIINKVLFVDGEILEPTENIKFNDFRVFAKGQKQRGIFGNETWNKDYYGPITVPDSCCFVMGDYRDNSLDSRYIGFINYNDIHGKLLYIYWSKDLKRIGIVIQ